MNVLAWLITASLAGTLVLLILSVLKPVTRKLFSKTWHYYTSFIPILFFMGFAGLFNFVQPNLGNAETYTQILQIGAPVAAPGVQAFTPAAPTLPEQMFASSMDFIREFAGWLALIWAVGAIIFIAVNIFKYQLYRRVLLQNSKRCFSIRCDVRVYTSKYAETPMLVGFMNPVIVLPNVKFSEKELELILSHELTHWRRKDVWVKFLVLLVNAAHWFNPAAYILNGQINTLCELSCDEKVVKNMDEQSRKFYGEIILSMLRQGSMRRNLICTSGLLGNSKRNIKNRLSNIVSARKTRKSVIALSVAAAMTVLIFGGVAASVVDFSFPEEVTEEYVEEIAFDVPQMETKPIEEYVETFAEDVALNATQAEESAGAGRVSAHPEPPSPPPEIIEPESEPKMLEPNEPAEVYTPPPPSVSTQRIESIILEQINEIRRDIYD